MRPNGLLTFNRRSIPLLNPTTIFGILFLLALFFIKTNGENGIGYAILSILIICIIPTLAKKTLSSVIIDQEKRTITLIINQWGWLNKEVLFPITEIRITFKTEIKMGSINRKVFRLFHKKKQVIAIHSIAGGWEPEILEKMHAIVDELNNNQTELIRK